jgi:TPR repeat protein
MIRKISLIILLLTACQFALADKAFDDLLAKANEGDVLSQTAVGDAFSGGQGVTQDYFLAFYWYKQAAEQGDAKAQHNLGTFYVQGKGVKSDYKQAVYWFTKAAEQGIADAQLQLGAAYQLGEGVTQDYKQAFYWYAKVAEQGFADAQYHLGVMYTKGQGVTQDYKQAVYWYTKAAEQGLAEAQASLGAKYQLGKGGLTQDYKQAFYWYSKAAENGSTDAQNALGIMFEEGEGVLKDYGQAVSWYEKTANQRDPSGQTLLGLMYRDGKGVERDYIEAYKWFDLASAGGNPDAKRALGYLESTMTAEQINEGQERARIWRPITNEKAGSQSTDLVDKTKFANDNKTMLALTKNGGVYEIPVILNGVLTIKFIVDSGASDVSISPDVAMTLVKTGTVSKNDFLEGKVYQFADGSFAESERFILHSIKIGSKVITNVPCSISKTTDAPMLLGQSALQKLGAYKIDYKTNQLSFE